jgi:DNA adenine methylase
MSVGKQTWKHISPFRYPGGKSWFYPVFKEWFEKTGSRTLVELFAGGASIGLRSLESGLCDRLVMIELDPGVAAVWQTILGNQWRALISRIEGFEPTLSEYKNEIIQKPKSKLSIGWQALLKNRLNHGGIIAPGAAPLKRGEADRGLGSRWYPETLVSRIHRIRELRGKIEFHHGDALPLLQMRNWDGCAFFVDPPYPVAGRRLYSHCQIDDADLLAKLKQTGRPFLATYENLDTVRSIAVELGLNIDHALMFARCHVHRTELIITG